MPAPRGDHAASYPPGALGSASPPRRKKRKAASAPQGEHAATHRTQPAESTSPPRRPATPTVTEHTHGQAGPVPGQHERIRMQYLRDLSMLHGALNRDLGHGWSLGHNPVAMIDRLAGSPVESVNALITDPRGTLFPQPQHLLAGRRGGWESDQIAPLEDQPINVGMIPYGPVKGTPIPRIRVGRGAHTARTLKAVDLEVQLPKSRSRLVGQPVARAADAVSRVLERTGRAANIPLLRTGTASERVTKAAGRAQRVESSRLTPEAHAAIKTLKGVKEGSPEDAANFWYAQLPAEYRNAEGLKLVQGKQQAEIERIQSGKAAEHLDAREAAVKADLAGAATGSQAGTFLRQLEEIKVLRADLPQRLEDTAASVARLGDLIAKPPVADQAAIDAVHALSGERQAVLETAGKLKTDRGEARRGLVSGWLGLEPTGAEAYIGHRLPRPDNKFSGKVSGGTGRPKVPQGVGSENRLVLASTGRLRQSLRVAAEDWHAAQAFKQANVARDDLGKLGTPFTGHVPEGHVLVNPKGRTIPAHWKTDEFAQFTDDYGASEDIRQRAQEVLDGFLADPKRDPAAVQQMLNDAAENGVQWNELRVVPKRLVDRYYAQFRRTKSAGTAGKVYDHAVDAVATSLIFARIGYIPKNLVQNLVMAVPHQGPLLLVNAVKAAQAMADPELRQLLRQEVGFSGATHGLGNEAATQKILGKFAHGVGTVADDPVRMSAFMHEAAAEGVVSKVNPLLTRADAAKLKTLLTSKAQRAKLNDIRSRSVEAMADFSRLTPDQAHMARRFLIIPGWLMAGSRYPFHFAINHPIRSALLAYIAMGEPGAPEELRFNKPADEYLAKDLPPWMQGFPLFGGIERINSTNPVSTPWDIGGALIGNSPSTAADYANPVGGAVAHIANREVEGTNGPYRVSLKEAAIRNAERLVPNLGLVQGLIDPQASKTYPEDATRGGRLKREVGIVPIEVTPQKPHLSLPEKAAAQAAHYEKLDGHPMDPADKRGLFLNVVYQEQEKRLKKDLGVTKLTDKQRAAIKLEILITETRLDPEGAQKEREYLKSITDPHELARETGYYNRTLNFGQGSALARYRAYIGRQYPDTTSG